MTNDFWTPQFHLFPPQGWMNDPNGLCQFKSIYHAFYQYTPKWPANDLRFWGHAVSKDLLSWETLPIAISPDTGNVMDETHPEADGIDVGREAYEVMVTSGDGLSFSPKRVVLKPADYPDTCTNHVRDPKVWEQDGVLRMLLGAREKDAAASNAKTADERHDLGAVLIYDSND